MFSRSITTGTAPLSKPLSEESLAKTSLTGCRPPLSEESSAKTFLTGYRPVEKLNGLWKV